MNANAIDLETFLARFDMLKSDIAALQEYPSVQGLGKYTVQYEDANGHDIILEARNSDGLIHVHTIEAGGMLEHRGGFTLSGLMSFYPTKEQKERLDAMEEYGDDEELY